MEKFLDVFLGTILPILILILGIVFSVFLYKKMKKKFNKPLDNTPKQNPTPQIKTRQSYCTEEEMKFLEALHRALPRDCIAFPHVGVSKLIEPKNNMNDYKTIVDRYVDVCIFLRKEMKPILVIDLYQKSPIAQQLKKFDDNITNVLKVAKIPILHKQIQQAYNLDDLLVEILNNVDGTVVAYLKSKFTTRIGK